MRQSGQLMVCKLFRKDVVKRAVDVDEKKVFISLMSSEKSEPQGCLEFKSLESAPEITVLVTA
jgi:hypothetical protein